MIRKVGAAGAAIAQPVLWSALGYQFEAGSMIAGLSACLMVRIWFRSPVALHGFGHGQ